MKQGCKLLWGMTMLMVGVALPAQASPELIKKARCVACHALDAKRLGPAYREVAEKYHGQADAPNRLFDKVRHGGAGAWGQVPMPPHGEDKISDADLKAVVHWILDGAK